MRGKGLYLKGYNYVHVYFYTLQPRLLIILYLDMIQCHIMAASGSSSPSPSLRSSCWASNSVSWRLTPRLGASLKEGCFWRIHGAKLLLSQDLCVCVGGLCGISNQLFRSSEFDELVSLWVSKRKSCRLSKLRHLSTVHSLWTEQCQQHAAVSAPSLLSTPPLVPPLHHH